jgi:glycosyltransferase involved in cell wall biosynthesis
MLPGSSDEKECDDLPDTDRHMIGKHTSALTPPRPLKPLRPGPNSRVAIGVPVRDGAAFIELALRTVTRQTHADLEIIISDNASADGTAEICQRFAREDPRIWYFRQPVALPADENFRFVLDQCESEWFMWASHDDLRDENYVEVLLSGFRSFPYASLVVTNAEIFSDHLQRVDAIGGGSPMRSTTGLTLTERHSVVVQNGAVQIYGLFRTEVLRSFRWRKVPVGTDWAILHWAVSFGDVVHVPGATFRYFIPALSRPDPSAYHWLRRRTWLDRIQVLPDVRWALQTSRELAFARGAHGLVGHRWRLFPALCFLQHGGAKAWAKSFIYRNAPPQVLATWRVLKRSRPA